MYRPVLQNQAALKGIRDEWDVGFGGCPGRRVEVQHQAGSKVGGEDEWRTLDGQHDLGL